MRATARDYFVRPAGNQSREALGTGNAVFLGGVVLITLEGAERVLVAPTSAWIWPGILGATAFVVTPLMFWMTWPELLLMVVVGLAFGGTLVLAAIGAYMVASRSRRRRLVVDARDRTCTEMDGARRALCVPARLMRFTRVQLYADRRYVDLYNVLIDLGVAELWVHQHHSEESATRIARTLAEALGIPHHQELERFS